MAVWQEAAFWIICSNHRKTLSKTDRAETNPTSRVKKKKHENSQNHKGVVCLRWRWQKAPLTTELISFPNFKSVPKVTPMPVITQQFWRTSECSEPQHWHGHWNVPDDWTLWPLFSCQSGWGSCPYRLVFWGLMSVVSAEQSEESTEKSWYIYDEYWWKGLLNKWFSLHHSFHLI